MAALGTLPTFYGDSSISFMTADGKDTTIHTGSATGVLPTMPPPPPPPVDPEEAAPPNPSPALPVEVAEAEPVSEAPPAGVAGPWKHPTGLPPPPSGTDLEVPPGAFTYTGPPLPPNVLGTSEWLPDDAALNCMRCGKEFTMSTRRHHCRQCGELFCHRCCNSKALLQPGSGTPPEARLVAHYFYGTSETHQDKPQKVCGKCFELLLPMQPFLAATSSKAQQTPDFTEPTYTECVKLIHRSFKAEIKRAVYNLSSFLGMPDADMVKRQIAAAHGIGLLSIAKAGFLGAVQGGGGLLLGRNQETGEWSAPCAIGCGGLSGGFQVAPPDTRAPGAARLPSASTPQPARHIRRRPNACTTHRSSPRRPGGLPLRCYMT